MVFKKNYFKLLVISIVGSLLFMGCTRSERSGLREHTFNRAMSSEPSTLHPISSSDVNASVIQDFVMDTLLVLDPNTREYMPGLAERHEVSDDYLTYTYYLRENAKFSDGEPVTAHDVKFTIDAIFDPEFNAAPKRSSLENLDRVEVIDDHTVKFIMKEKYFRNFEVLATYFSIVPRHIYHDPKARLARTLVGSGPYTLHRYDHGRSVILKRNPDWWGFEEEHLKGYYNFEYIHFRIVTDDNARLSMTHRGDLDFMELTPEQYSQRTEGGNWGDSVHKQKVSHLGPKGFGFVAWNFNNELFQDKKVRRALAHLMNRELMNERFRFKLSELATGPWFRHSIYADPNVKPIPFDVDKAKKLLEEAGWKDSDQDGVLDKVIDGEKRNFRFTLFSANPDFEKYWTVYQQDLKRAGIDMRIVTLEWNAFVRKLDERDFDAVSLGWGRGSTEIDPKQIWHSESAQASGSNFINYKNPKVDELIDKARVEFDQEKRIKILQEVYRIIADDAPYVFLFNDTYNFYAHSDRIEFDKPTLKHAVGIETWRFKNLE